MANKKTMVICHDWLPLFKSMEPDDVCKIIFALMECDATGDAPQTEFNNKLVEALYQNMLSFVVDNRTAYLETCRKNADNSKKRWSKPNDASGYERMRADATEYERIRPNTNVKDNDNDNENENDNESESDSTPTLAEVKSFCASEGLKAINTKKFYNYYSSMDWKVYGQPIDWKARARYWDNGDKQGGGFNDFAQRENDWSKLEKDLLKK